MIDVDTNRYSSVKRADAMAILSQANLAPDKFIAHRDRTFTAKYHKDRVKLFDSDVYEDRMESAGNYNVAIFKRPSHGIDKGKYVTLRFSFVATERLGLRKEGEKAHPQNANTNGNGKTNGHTETGDLALLSRLSGTTRDMKYLTQYAQELVEDGGKQNHLLITIREMQKHIDQLSEGITQLVKGHTT